MKKFILFFALLASAALAQGKTGAFGLWLQGGNAGEYWGVDYKKLGKDAVTDIYLHLSASGDNFSLGLYGGYYFTNNAIKSDASMGKFPLHYGPVIGFGYWTKDNTPTKENFNGFAFRGGVVGGISWVLPTALPMDISIELNPVIEVKYESWENGNENERSEHDTTWEIPNLYFRILFHVYVF